MLQHVLDAYVHIYSLHTTHTRLGLGLGLGLGLDEPTLTPYPNPTLTYTSARAALAPTGAPLPRASPPASVLPLSLFSATDRATLPGSKRSLGPSSSGRSLGASSLNATAEPARQPAAPGSSLHGSDLGAISVRSRCDLGSDLGTRALPSRSGAACVPSVELSRATPPPAANTLSDAACSAVHTPGDAGCTGSAEPHVHAGSLPVHHPSPGSSVASQLRTGQTVCPPTPSGSTTVSGADRDAGAPPGGEEAGSDSRPPLRIQPPAAGDVYQTPLGPTPTPSRGATPPPTPERPRAPVAAYHPSPSRPLSVPSSRSPSATRLMTSEGDRDLPTTPGSSATVGRWTDEIPLDEIPAHGVWGSGA